MLYLMCQGIKGKSEDRSVLEDVCNVEKCSHSYFLSSKTLVSCMVILKYHIFNKQNLLVPNCSGLDGSGSLSYFREKIFLVSFNYYKRLRYIKSSPTIKPGRACIMVRYTILLFLSLPLSIYYHYFYKESFEAESFFINFKGNWCWCQHFCLRLSYCLCHICGWGEG